MEIQDFWNTYSSGLAPAEFVWRFGKGNAAISVAKYIRTCPAMYGILCHKSWKSTFASQEQYNRERVAAALLTYLELNRTDWEKQVEEYAAAEEQEHLKKRKFENAKALATAVAQVEAKALGNVDDHINPNRQEEEIQSNPIAPQEHEKSSPPTYPVETDLHNAPSLHVESDEKAIAEAMARVEEKARENISGEEPEKIQSPECDETLAHKQSKISTQESISHIKSESGLEQAHTQMDANAIATAMEQIEIKAQEKEKQKHCNDTPPPVELTQSPEKLQKEEDDKSSPSMHPSNDSTSNP